MRPQGRFTNARLRRASRIAAVASVLTLLSAVALLAHDFWIVPNAFLVATGGTIEIRGQTGTKFP